jgi:hypothetical protein
MSNSYSPNILHAEVAVTPVCARQERQEERMREEERRRKRAVRHVSGRKVLSIYPSQRLYYSQSTPNLA